MGSPEQHKTCAHSVDTRLAVYMVLVAARSNPVGAWAQDVRPREILAYFASIITSQHYPLQPSLYHNSHQPCYSLACGRVFALAPSDAAPSRAVRLAASARRPAHRDPLRYSLSKGQRSVCCTPKQQPPLLPLALSSRPLSSWCPSTTLHSCRPQGAADPRSTLAK